LSKTASNQHGLKNRKQCLFNLKEVRYQVGSGFMVCSPFQTLENIVEYLRFLQDLQPGMIGVGLYLAHEQTPFAEFAPEKKLHSAAAA